MNVAILAVSLSFCPRDELASFFLRFVVLIVALSREKEEETEREQIASVTSRPNKDVPFSLVDGQNKDVLIVFSR